MPAELWAKVLEQFLMVNLILGRWLLPKGELTRGQLSQLLLVYIGMAADIVELFEAFKEDAVIFNTELTTAVLAIWSWSLMQFSFVLTATKARKPRLGMDSVPKDNHVSNYDKSCCPNLRAFCIMDIWAIATTIIFQDGPFLCLRLLLILKYNVVSYLNIFFTCKNSLVLVLQLYRMTVLKCETHPMSDDVESIHQGSSKLDHDSDKSETESNKYDEAGVDYLYGNRDDLPWHRSSIHHRRNSETLDKKPSPDMNYNFLPDYFDPIKRIRKGPCRATKDNSLFKNIDGFTEINRDSVYLVYSQSKDAPWTDVSLNLFSTSESNLNKDPKKKSGTVINLHQNKTDELIKRNDIAVQTSEFKNHHKTLKKTKKSSRSALTSEKIHRSKTDEKEATINNVKNCLKSSKSLNKAVSSRMTPSSYCMSTRF